MIVFRGWGYFAVVESGLTQGECDRAVVETNILLAEAGLFDRYAKCRDEF